MIHARSRCLTVLRTASLLLPLALATAASAQQPSWDPAQSNGTTPGGGGTWDLTTPNWFNGTGNVTWPNDSTAVFGGAAAGTLNVSGLSPSGVGGVSAGGLTFSTAGYKIGGDPINLS